MTKIINHIVGFFLGLAPLVLVAALGAVFYFEEPSVILIVVFAILGVGALFIGLKIFQKVKAKGVISFFSGIYGSPEIDNLLPTENSIFRILSSSEFVREFSEKKKILNSGTLEIFGSSIELSEGANSAKILAIDYDESKLLLGIHFDGGKKVSCWKPEFIHVEKSYIKIVKARRVRYETTGSLEGDVGENAKFVDVSVLGTKIETQTNMDKRLLDLDLSIAKPSIFISNY